MSEDFYSIVTDYGSQKQLNSIKNGTPFDVQEIALGDSGGSYYNPSPSQTALRKEVDKYTTEGDLRREVQMNIKGKMEINSYQGTRHKKGLPVHGQRTSRNAKTRKGKGKVVANKKKVGK